MPFAEVPEDEQRIDYDSTWIQDQAWMTQQAQNDHDGGLSLQSMQASLRGGASKSKNSLSAGTETEPRPPAPEFVPFSWEVFWRKMWNQPGFIMMLAIFAMILVLGLFVLFQNKLMSGNW